MGKHTEELRNKLIQRGISPSYLDDVIDRLKHLLSANIDIAWGEHPVQLARHSSSEKRFCQADGCGKIEEVDKIKKKSGF